MGAALLASVASLAAPFVVLLAVIVIPVVLFVHLLLRDILRNRRWKATALRSVMERFHLEPVPGDDKSMRQVLFGFLLFGQARRGLSHAMRCRNADLEVYVGDYSVVGPRETVHLKVICFRWPRLALPVFRLHPRWGYFTKKMVMRRLEESPGGRELAGLLKAWRKKAEESPAARTLGGLLQAGAAEGLWPTMAPADRIELPKRAAFSDRCGLSGPDEQAIRDLMTEPLLAFYEAADPLYTEGTDDRLLLYRKGTVLPENLAGFLEEGYRLLGLFLASSAARQGWQLPMGVELTARPEPAAASAATGVTPPGQQALAPDASAGRPLAIGQTGIPAELLGLRSVRMRNWDGGVSAARLVLGRFACVVGMLLGLWLVIAMLVSPVWALAGTDYAASIGPPGGGTEYLQVRFSLAGRQVEKRLRITAREYASLYAAASAGPRPAAERTVHVRVLSLGAWYSAYPIASPGQARSRVIERWLQGLIVNGLLLLAVNAFWVKPWRVWSLYRHGRPVPGLITGKRKELGSVPFSLLLDFVFLTPDNQQHQGTVKVAEKAWEQARKGESVTVLHPERRTEPSVIYQYGPYRCD